MQFTVAFPKRHATALARVLRMGLIAADFAHERGNRPKIPSPLKRKLEEWYKKKLGIEGGDVGVRVVVRKKKRRK